MNGTGIFVAEKELARVKAALSRSDMCASLAAEVAKLAEKYNPPENTALSMKTGEFIYPSSAYSNQTTTRKECRYV